MASFFYDLALIEHEDTVNAHDRRKTVSDDEGGFLFNQLGEGVLDEHFAFGI